MRAAWWALMAALGVAFVAGLPRGDAVPAFARREGVARQMRHLPSS
jgi:hypothetical protein